MRRHSVIVIEYMAKEEGKELLYFGTFLGFSYPSGIDTQVPECNENIYVLNALDCIYIMF